MRRLTAALLAAALVLAAAAPAVGLATPTTDERTPDAVEPRHPAGQPGSVAAQSGATNCTFPASVTDATGTEVTLDERPDRVTTLGASAAQTMWEIGGREQVVGLTQNALYLDGAASRTNVSGPGFYPDRETVVGTNPDLVLAPNIIPDEEVAALRDLNLTVYRVRPATNVSDVREKTTRIGRLTGNCAGAAEANAWMDANVRAATTATGDLDRPTALYPVGGGFVANTDTFISAMIEAAGADNALAEANVTGAYPQVSDEVILAVAPEYLVLTNGSASLAAQEPYASTPAAAANRTVFVDPNYLNQPAPRSVVFAVRNLTRGFHPDANAAFVSRDEIGERNETPTPTPTPTPEPPDDDDDDDDDEPRDDPTPTPTPTATPTATQTATPTATDTETDAPSTTETESATATATPAAADRTTAAATESGSAAATETAAPGFGVLLALCALLASALLARRDR